MRAGTAATYTKTDMPNIDIESLLAACLPGSDSCDPQRVADDIRRWAAAQSAPAEPPKAEWSDPRVQAVYAILASDEVPPAEQHWEGWAARRIVDALCGAPAEPQPVPAGEALPEPVAWVNRDELDNMLDDRTATIAGIGGGWRRVSLYTADQMRAYAAQAVAAERERCKQAIRNTKDKNGTNDDGTNWLMCATSSDYIAAIDALPAAQSASAGAVPAGWQIERSTLPGSGQVPAIVIVQLGAQAAAVTALDDHLAGMLYSLADALLTASETSQPKDAA